MAALLRNLLLSISLLLSCPSAWAAIDDGCSDLLQAAELVRRKDVEAATKLIAKVRKASRIVPVGAEGVPVDFGNSDLMLVFSPETLAKIEQGGFKNVHETKTSAFVGEDDDLAEYIGYRRKLEATMAGSSVKKSMRPKYAVVQVYDENLMNRFVREGLDMAGHDGIESYGGAAAVLKPEVKKRATFTLFDSLQRYGELAADAQEARVRANLRTFSEHPENLNLDAVEMDYRYVEAQIWGPLDLSDVAYFILHPGTREFPAYPQVIQKYAQILRSTGKPVYLGKSMTTKLRDVFPNLKAEDREVLESIGYLVPGEKLD